MLLVAISVIYRNTLLTLFYYNIGGATVRQLQTGSDDSCWKSMVLPLNLGDQSSLARRLVEATVGSAGVRVIGMALTFLVGVQLARFLGPAGYGVYGTVMAMAALLAVPAQLGLPQLLTREISAYTATGDVQRAKGALVWFTAVVCAASATVAAIGWLGLMLWPGGTDSAFSRAFLWGLAGIPVTALINLGISTLRGFQNVIGAQVYDCLVRPGLFAAFLMAAAALLSGIDVGSALALQTLAGLIALAACAGHVYRRLPRDVVEAAPIRLGREWIRSAAPMTGTEILRVFDAHYAVLLLGLLASIGDVGVFRVALAAAGFVGLPSTIINLVVMPYVANLHAAGDRVRLQKVASGAALAMTTITAAVTLVLFMVGEPLLALVFGKSFAPAWLPLFLMGVAYTLNAFFGSAATMLNMCGHERTVAAAYIASPALGATLTLTLYGWLGISAAPAGMIVAELVKGVWMTRTSRRALGVDPSLAGLLLGVRNVIAKPGAD